MYVCMYTYTSKAHIWRRIGTHGQPSPAPLMLTANSAGPAVPLHRGVTHVTTVALRTVAGTLAVAPNLQSAVFTDKKPDPDTVTSSPPAEDAWEGTTLESAKLSK